MNRYQKSFILSYKKIQRYQQAVSIVTLLKKPEKKDPFYVKNLLSNCQN